MVFYVDSVKAEEELKEYSSNDGHTYCCFMNFDEVKEWHEFFGFPPNFQGQWGTGIPSKFESYGSFDFIFLNVLDKMNIFGKMRSISIVFNDHLIVFVSSDSHPVEEIVFSATSESDWRNANVYKLLLGFFENLTSDDIGMLQDIEQQVLMLEDSLIHQEHQSFAKEIMGLRKCAMMLKRYYEQLIDIVLKMEENESLTREKTQRTRYKLLRIKLDRLHSNVINLRDYINHVFDAYQTHVSLNLNNTMKFFTVVATIFLPLTLMTSWYGMNLQMPEFDWLFGYPIIIVLAVIIVVFCIYLFKRKGWF